ncbi:hypothetical protein [Halalkalicoccus tibetensis]|uniref:Uncharacterized protein n=1 Tax=Halalkalicoccus tibetensis TaxID=175632 RepID=A0ABD5V907_9EURY
MSDARYGARIDGGTFYLAREGDRVEVGPMDTIVEHIGGETYTLEYTSRQSAVSWLATDADDTITLDVRQELEQWEYTDAFVEDVKRSPPDEEASEGARARTRVFADLVTDIWDSKGNLDG